jgi:UDP-N-acetylglucosamine acyltransferase
LGGHATIEDWVILGGFVGIHQFCKIGAHAFIGMGSLVNADVPPFVMIADRYAEPRGINSEGLKRRGFDAERIAAIKRAYRSIFMSGKPLADAKAELAESAQSSEDVRQMLAFIDASQRGLQR